MKILPWPNFVAAGKNGEIFVHLDELDKLEKITYALVGFNYSLTQTQKSF